MVVRIKCEKTVLILWVVQSHHVRLCCFGRPSLGSFMPRCWVESDPVRYCEWAWSGHGKLEILIVEKSSSEPSEHIQEHSFLFPPLRAGMAGISTLSKKSIPIPALPFPPSSWHIPALPRMHSRPFSRIQIHSHPSIPTLSGNLEETMSKNVQYNWRNKDNLCLEYFLSSTENKFPQNPRLGIYIEPDSCSFDDVVSPHRRPMFRESNLEAPRATVQWSYKFIGVRICVESCKSDFILPREILDFNLWEIKVRRLPARIKTEFEGVGNPSNPANK